MQPANRRVDTATNTQFDHDARTGLAPAPRPAAAPAQRAAGGRQPGGIADNPESRELAQVRRREIKAIEKTFARETLAVSAAMQPLIEVEKLEAFREKTVAMRARLATLRAAGLPTRPPTPSGTRSLKSGAVLIGGSASRAGAYVASRTIAVGELLASPLTLAAKGAAIGFACGVDNAPSVLLPVAAIGGMGVGAAAGAVLGACSIVPRFFMVGLAQDGSIGVKAYHKLDKFPDARVHVWQKKLSTEQIARDIEDGMTEVIGQIDQQIGSLEDRAAR